MKDICFMLTVVALTVLYHAKITATSEEARKQAAHTFWWWKWALYSACCIDLIRQFL